MSCASTSSWNGNESAILTEEPPLPLNRRRYLQLTALAAAGALARAPRARPALARPRVVIVGGGFAGSACALRLRALQERIDVTLIDPDEHYTTCPMSNEVIAGLRALRSITVSRQGLRRAGVTVVPDRVIGIETGPRQVRLGAGATLSFDRLVVAPGIRFLWDRIEGYDEAATRSMPHAWKAGEQTVLLARQLRRMDDGGVVAISVPSGLLRCPPGPYERASLIAHYLRERKPRSKIIILDANNAFPKQALFTDAWSRLYRGMIEWIALTEGGAVLRVDTARMRLYTANAEHRVALANVIPPQAPGEIARALGLAADHGWCPIEAATFESTLQPGIHVIGDACIADAMPKSASAAYSQARQCAAAIAAMLAGGDVPQPAFESACYSLLAPELAIAFPGHFTLAEGRIVAPEAAAPPVAPLALEPEAAAQAARDAEQWYRSMLKQTFAACSTVPNSAG